MFGNGAKEQRNDMRNHEQEGEQVSLRAVFARSSSAKRA